MAKISAPLLLGATTSMLCGTAAAQIAARIDGQGNFLADARAAAVVDFERIAEPGGFVSFGNPGECIVR